MGRMPTALGTGLRSSIGTRRGELARPMTAVRAAGYTSGGRKSTFDGVVANAVEKKVDLARQKMLKLEHQTFELMKESIFAYEAKTFKVALEKAKEAGRKEREAAKQREQYKLGEAYADMTFAVLNNLAQQYLANGMLNDALNTYQVIVKEPMYANSGRLKVNIGNIHFRKKDYIRALKYYRMALDRIPQFQARMRCKIQNNAGVALVRLGKYEDAMAHFEECMDQGGDYAMALNLVLTAYCLDDNDKMREAFQRLVDIPVMVEDEIKYNQVSFDNISPQ
uniref:Uncharacterized protein n=1 Tax=Panagrolaimus superbus TaxID=310955 RepID=A0A914YAU3_9BILA